MGIYLLVFVIGLLYFLLVSSISILLHLDTIWSYNGSPAITIYRPPADVNEEEVIYRAAKNAMTNLRMYIRSWNGITPKSWKLETNLKSSGKPPIPW